MILEANDKNQAGFGAFAYILMSIALLAALTTAISVGSRSNTRVQNNDIQVSKIYGQASKIRSDILLCMTEVQVQTSGVGPTAYQRFPACDDTTQGGTQANTNYTADGYCTNVSTSNPIIANAKNLRCLSPSSASVWDNSEGNFFPDPIPGFEPWKYAIIGDSNDAYKGVSLLITTQGRTSSTDTDWVLRKVRDKFGPNEAQVLIRNGDDANDGKINVSPCVGNSICNTLQVWLAK
ncbi:MAG: hypothetical protein EYC62_09250 [Alphaproteobacteria bacterium]|nr:MAG: hypothetical protein EYC62_09250 [Alphaproteobacteria bacterium]